MGCFGSTSGGNYAFFDKQEVLQCSPFTDLAVAPTNFVDTLKPVCGVDDGCVYGSGDLNIVSTTHLLVTNLQM